jgi:hypothetical protein
VARADRRRGDRGDRRTPKREPQPSRGSAEARTKTRSATAPRFAWPTVVADRTLLEHIVFATAAVVFLIALARMLEARITWYLAVDQFGYLQFAHDLLRGKIFHDWEPATIMGLLPKRTDVLAQTYIWDNGRMYCRYAPGFPILVAGWTALFGDARVSFLNPTIYLGLLAVVGGCSWRLTGSPWRGLAAAVLIALCPSRMYWWSLTLTRDLSAHFFAFIGLYQLIPRDGAPFDRRRALVAGLAIGFAASIRNDAVLYLLPATLLAAVAWRRERPTRHRAGVLLAVATAGLLIGMTPTLAYNAITTGNPLRATQGMEVEKFLTNAADEMKWGTPRIGYPPQAPGARPPSGLWRGTAYMQVSGGGLRLENFWRTAPNEWRLIQEAYGPVLIGLAALGAVAALVVRPVLFLFTVPYAVTAFLFYSCWNRADHRYIIGAFIMISLLIVEGVIGSVETVRLVAERRGEGVARPIAAVLALVAVLVAIAPIPLPPPSIDASFLSKNVLPVLVRVLPAALAIGAGAAAVTPAAPVVSVLAPTLALVLTVFGIVRADATRPIRAPFQKTQATIARETLRRTLEPRSIVITSEDIGRPAENIEYYGGFPAFYLTDLERWRIKPSQASQAFISAGVRPYLLVDQPTNAYEAEERRRFFADLAEHGFVADRLLEIPPEKKMQYFVASPRPRPGAAELFRISQPKLEALLRDVFPGSR